MSNVSQPRAVACAPQASRKRAESRLTCCHRPSGKPCGALVEQSVATPRAQAWGGAAARLLDQHPPATSATSATSVTRTAAHRLGEGSGLGTVCDVADVADVADL